MSGGSGGPTKQQEAAQEESLQLARRAEQRELDRERSLKERTLARQRSRRFGQFGRASLAFNPGRKDLGITGALPDPAAEKAAAERAAQAARNRASGTRFIRKMQQRADENPLTDAQQAENIARTRRPPRRKTALQLQFEAGE